MTTADSNTIVPLHRVAHDLAALGRKSWNDLLGTIFAHRLLVMKFAFLSSMAVTLFAQAQSPSRVPLVGVALSCAKTSGAGGLVAGNDM